MRSDAMGSLVILFCAGMEASRHRVISSFEVMPSSWASSLILIPFLAMVPLFYGVCVKMRVIVRVMVLE